MVNELMLYIHIPFCVKKCNYCDFLSFSVSDEVKKQYVDVLIQEIIENAKECEGYDISSIFIGGGTPSILELGEIERILCCVRQNYAIKKDAEITIECNPGTVTKEKLEEYRRSGINRISFGLQSARDDELKLLGRIHNYQDFVTSYNLARAAGFANINIDLIEGLPGQTKSDFMKTLHKVISLNPEHISVYGLIIEPGTPFYDKYKEDGPFEKDLPSDEMEREIYYEARIALKEQGYEQYEISNFAKEGYACTHNVGYWTRKNYLGFGLGASSLIANVRYKNVSDLSKYLEKDFSRYEEEYLSQTEQRDEMMFLGLRMTKGVDKLNFEKEFGIPASKLYEAHIQKMQKEGLLTESDTHIYLTRKGMDLANYVMAGFVE